MNDRHHGRLEGLLLAVAVTAAVGLALGGVWRISHIAENSSPQFSEAVAISQRDALVQVVSLVRALVESRRCPSGGQDPPK
jgi:hypothetical protein